MFHSHLETILLPTAVQMHKEQNSNPDAFVAANQHEAVERAANESVDDQPFRGGATEKTKAVEKVVRISREFLEERQSEGEKETERGKNSVWKKTIQIMRLI